MSQASTSMDGGISGPVSHTGGISGPVSAETLGENAMSEPQSASTIINLFIGFPPFLQTDELDSIDLNPVDPSSLFAHFWQLRSSGQFTDALNFCDLILEVIPAGDFDSHLRQANARAMALRDLCDYRGAYRAHAAARPLLAFAAPSYVGDHHHGLGITLTRLGEHARAERCFETARELHKDRPVKLAHTDINTAELLVGMGKVAEAHAILDGVREPSMWAHVEIARALAYEAEGDKAGARRSIAEALVLLADSDNKASRDEARRVLAQIEGDEAS